MSGQKKNAQQFEQSILAQQNKNMSARLDQLRRDLSDLQRLPRR
jgi:Mg2+ and Co2+ transporter CorA